MIFKMNGRRIYKTCFCVFHEIFFLEILGQHFSFTFHQRPFDGHNCIIAEGPSLPPNKVIYDRHEYHMVSQPPKISIVIMRVHDLCHFSLEETAAKRPDNSSFGDLKHTIYIPPKRLMAETYTQC